MWRYVFPGKYETALSYENWPEGFDRDKKEKIRCSYDQYVVRTKGSVYKVVVFPYLEECILYYAGIHEDTYDRDLSADAARTLAKAYAILIRDPGAIVYVPMKKPEDRLTNFNLVLCRHTCMMKPGRWLKIEKQLNAYNKVHNYRFWYEPQKLRDYFYRIVVRKNERLCRKEYNRLFSQREIGDYVIESFSLDGIYEIHENLLSAAEFMDEADERNEEKASGWGYGYMVSKALIRKNGGI